MTTPLDTTPARRRRVLRGSPRALASGLCALTLVGAGLGAALSPATAMADGAGRSAGAQVVSGAGLLHHTSISNNWSGEEMKSKTRGTFQGISAYWRVPRVKATARNKYSSTWVGVDGANNSSLIQTGTESDSVNGHTQYHAWWEILPASERLIRFSNGQLVPVRPGDLMWGYVVKTATPGVWRIYLQDLTRGWKLDITRRYNGPGRSAEWIEEATQVGGKISPMPRFTPVTFTQLQVAESGKWYYTALGASNKVVLVQHRHRKAHPARVVGTNPQSFTVYHS